MAKIEIARSNGKPLEFNGGLIARSLSAADEQGRHYVVSVYASEDALPGPENELYMTVVEFRSDVAKEPPYAIAEIVQTIQDVEKFLCMFEPLEYMKCDHVDNLSMTDRREFTQRLFQLYDEVVVAVLGKLGILSPPQESRPVNPANL